MKKFNLLSTVVLICLFAAQFYCQELNNSYHYSIDLNNIKDNKIQVTLVPPSISKGEVIFRLPRMVPGTYHVYDFGRFVSELQAFDINGNPLPVSRIDSNSWNITANNLAKITYYAEDSWNTKNPNNKIFEPVGLNLQVNKNYVINSPCIFGYFEDMTHMNFEVSITKPDKFYGSSPLIPVYSDNKIDKFSVNSYFELTDSPMMYDIPDTTILKIGATDVLISVYSPNKEISSKTLASKLKVIVNAQKKYLGGKLPVKKYAYIYYFVPFEQKSRGSFGALEHNNSSLYFLPERKESESEKMVLNASAHEFFHIITPLTIHSDEIQNFDFDNPKMSEHLWLYEGMTEYSAMICQVKEGVISRDEFLDMVKEKIITSGAYNDTLPFTEMSRNVLDKYLNEYTNVYQKGALIGMCLDIQLRSLSNGKLGVREMMQELAKRYGKDKAFKDDELFDIIASFTYPEIRNFFRLYVEGPKPLPYNTFLSLAGIDYDKIKTVKEFTLGKVAIAGSSEKKYIEVVDNSNMNDFGKEMGYKKGDLIKSINGIEAPADVFRKILDSQFKKSKPGDILTLVVLRKDESGDEHEVSLKAKMYTVDAQEENVIDFNENANENQLMIRDAWLGEN